MVTLEELEKNINTCKEKIEAALIRAIGKVKVF